MATPSRRTDPPLEQTLFEEPYRFDFFQAVRLLARLNPERASVGREGPANREVVRFLTHLTMSFPASSIRSLEPRDLPGAAPGMRVNFFGLTGPSGVLPHVYTELLMERSRLGDHSLAAFFDLINHRLISLFYRAWEKHHFIVAREHGGDEPFARHLFDLIGLGTTALRNRHEFPDAALLPYSGFFARRQRPAVVLESLLRDYFDFPIEIEQFVGRWLQLEPSDCSSLGALGRNNELGGSLVLGSRAWDAQGKIRIRLGPLSFDRFQALQPDGPEFLAVAQMVRLFVDVEFEFDVQLILKAEDVPPCRLSSQGSGGARLGRHAWLRSRPLQKDVDDAVFTSSV
ncbi:type VI secretion system protein ImpH [Singulisphaera sp. GP187]|uniref:type VI secretion system baseplate subunit TssG n=1 Tax=Singulisphaera sp. GP187 TaxID=1882752 RepID=UPI000925F552|nr:type VI secretion system baseplate subunit TssG [Singulisphaera sp. GP187]SIO61733.1 type VI secretion system protein ImpH [Singulisphaera sp. GP187]